MNGSTAQMAFVISFSPKALTSPGLTPGHAIIDPTERILQRKGSCLGRPVVRSLRPRLLPRSCVARNVVAGDVVRAKAFKTGERLSLSKVSPHNSPVENRYILCPECVTAYVGNSISSSVQVKCPACSHMFEASPQRLYVCRNLALEKKVAERNKTTEEEQEKQLDPDKISCKHFGKCPGCTLDSEISYPPVANEVKIFAKRVLGFRKTITVEIDKGTQWRTHAKLAIRQQGIGLFRQRSHHVIEIPKCVVHHPAINSAVSALQDVLQLSAVPAYNDVTGKGGPRYALFAVERKSGKVQLTIVWNASSWKDAHPAATRVATTLWNRHNSLFHSIWFNWNTSSGNAITSPKDNAYYHMFGLDHVEENVCGANIYFLPSTFRQANLDSFEKLLLPRLHSYILPGSSIIEMYAGVGVIGLTALAQKKLNLRYLMCTEVNKHSRAPFQMSLSALNQDAQSKAEFIAGSDVDTIELIVEHNPDIVIVDPPRAGLSEECMRFFASAPQQLALKRLIYVSCSFESFMRDSRHLAQNGWQVHALHEYVLFPGNNHVELLAIFDRYLPPKPRTGRFLSKNVQRKVDDT